MPCKIDLTKNDLKLAIEQNIKISERAAKNAANDTIRKAHQEVVDFWKRAETSIVEIK